MTFIFFLLILFVFFLILVPTILFSVIRTIFSVLGVVFGSRSRGRRARRSDARSSASENYSHYEKPSSGGAKAHKKMFDKNEGEYVDFEEIKD